MYARLGFAVAVNLEPDVLLVDEVLAVGDENFQRKCLERVRRFQTEGRTIVLVTHSPDQVIQLCDRALVLDHGHSLHVGDTAEAVRVFRHALHSSSGSTDPVLAEAAAAAAGGALRITGATATADDGSDTVHPGDGVTIELRYVAADLIPAARARIVITTHDGVQMLNASTFDLLGHDLEALDGTGSVRFRIDRLPYLDGSYRVGLVLQDPSETFQYDQDLEACTFDVFSGRPIVGRVELDIEVEHSTGQRTP